ncbi:MAG: carboxypeptidase regulatory-like domain-containing protein [Bacteroidales bacterium]|nr:carboxypeptidase regulatory-like domain-containing protein [Bacteroidales bacterium]
MKRKFLLLVMMCLLGGLGSSLMAQDVTIGANGTTESSIYPYISTYNYSTSQQIYKVAEIGQAGTISKISFYVNDPDVNKKVYDVKIYIKHTDKDAFSGKTDWDKTVTSDHLVYDGNPTITNSVLEIPLSTPFEYNGTQNLLVCFDVNSKQGDATYYRTYSADSKRVMYYRNANNYGPDATNYYNQGASSQPANTVPMITLTFGGGAVPPTAVTNVSPSNNTTYGSNPQELAWTFGANTTQYQVLVGTEKEDGENGRVINTLGQQDFVEKGEGNNGSYSAEGLSAGTQYCWQVISKNENGETAGDIWYFTTVNDVEPTDMVTKTYPENAAFVKLNAVKLQWQYNNDNHDRYTIYLGESATDMPVLATGIDNITEYTPDNLQGEKTYYWRVDVNNAIYTSEDTEVWSFTTQSVGNIDGIVKNNDVFVSGATISIKDLNGNLVGSTTTAGSGNFAFNDVVIGEYLLYIEVEGMETYTLNLKVVAGQTTSLGTIYLPSIIVADNTWNITNAELSENNELIVRANAVLTAESVVGTLTIESGKSVTIKDGAVLTVVGKINNNGEIIIEDGGQIFQNNEGVQATFKMNVENPDEWSDDNTAGWQFIASPFADATTASFIPTEGNYDLYKFDGAQELEWVNYKKEISNSDNQPLVQIGEGEYYVDNFQKQAPLCDYYKYFASQTIYTAEEIGVEEGVISSISYNLQSAYENTRNISVYLKNTERTESYSSWEALTSDLCVFSGEVTYGTTAGWFTINLQNKFSYTGGNLLVTVIDNTGQYGAGNKFYSYETGSYTAPTDIRTIYKNNTSYIDPLNITTLGKSGLTAVIGESAKCLTPQIKLDFRTEIPFEETFVSGVGYIASYETEETATLSGNLYNEDNFTYKVSYNEDKDLANFHLLGNPFPFNMDWSNISLEGVYNGFATVDPATGGYITATEGTIPVGNGFFVKATAENPRISYATASKSRAKKSEYINVVATGRQGSNNLIVKFDGEEKVGFAKLSNINPSIADVYVKNNNKKYSILSYDRNVTEVELFFDAKEMGNYTISLDIKGNFESVTLVDRMTGAETNMLLEDGYSFTATGNENPNRFVLKLANGQDTTGKEQFVYQSGEELIVEAEGTIQIIDMMGRVVYSSNVENGRINVSGFNKSAYIVRAISEGETKVQKVVIY